MKTKTIKKAQTLVVGSVGFIVGIVLLSSNTLHTTMLTTLTIIGGGICSLIVGINFLLKYIELGLLKDLEEIDMMKDEEITQLMQEIENMESSYFHHDPKMKMLYEELGEKMMERYRLRCGDDLD